MKPFFLRDGLFVQIHTGKSKLKGAHAGNRTGGPRVYACIIQKYLPLVDPTLMFLGCGEGLLKRDLKMSRSLKVVSHVAIYIVQETEIERRTAEKRTLQKFDILHKHQFKMKQNGYKALTYPFYILSILFYSYTI